MINEQRTYTIPLRKAYQDKAPQRRAKTAVKAIKSFLSKHMKADESNIKVSSNVNEVIWANGARNPPAKITVVADPIETTITVRTEDEHHVSDEPATTESDQSDDTDESAEQTDDADESSSSDETADDEADQPTETDEEDKES